MAFIEPKGGYKYGTAYVVHWDAPPDLKHKTRARSKTFRRRKDAVAFKAEKELELARGTYVDTRAGEAPIASLAETYLDAKRGIRTAKYVESLESSWTTHVAPQFGKWPIARLKHSDVQAWVSTLSQERSATTVNRALDVLRGICKMAVADARIGRNPCDGIQKPNKPTKRMEDRHYLTIRQLFALADASGRWRPLVLTLGLCGLRYGEARALTVKCVDFKKHRIRVEASTTRSKGKWVTNETKTHARRDVPMPKAVESVLRPLVEDLDADDLVFTRPDGKVIDEQSAKHRVKNVGGKYWWWAALQGAGLDDMRVHDLRHTAASIAVSAGANVLLVQRMLGHKNAAMTLNTYADLFDADMDIVSKTIDAHVQDALGGTPI